MSVIEIDTPNDDIEDVMNAVGDAVESWERAFASPGDRVRTMGAGDDLRQRASLLRHQWRVDGNAIIHSSRPRLGPWLVRFQRFVRRLTWWFVDPVIHQIGMFQRNSARVIDGLAQEHAQLANRVGDLGELCDQLQALEARLAQLEQRIEAAEGTKAREG